MPEVSLILDSDSNVALISDNNLAANAIFSSNEDSTIIVSNLSANAAIINGDTRASSMVIASSVGMQGPQGDNDNAIAYSIALG
jgi:hypothetical protein